MVCLGLKFWVLGFHQEGQRKAKVSHFVFAEAGPPSYVDLMMSQAAGTSCLYGLLKVAGAAVATACDGCRPEAAAFTLDGSWAAGGLRTPGAVQAASGMQT